MISQEKNWLHPSIIMKPSPIHGRGMFVTEDIKAGEKLIVWKEGYTDRAGIKIPQELGLGTMQWDEDVFSCEGYGKEEDYLINHSCDPNTWMADAFTVVVRRDVSAGEELTVDCAMFEADESYVSEWECRCGSLLCRGKVTGKDWRMVELQERYRGHFSPLIEKRITRLKDVF